MDLKNKIKVIDLNKNKSLLTILSEIQSAFLDRSLSLEFDTDLSKWILKGQVIEMLFNTKTDNTDYPISSTEIFLIKDKLIKRVKDFVNEK